MERRILPLLLLAILFASVLGGIPFAAAVVGDETLDVDPATGSSGDSVAFTVSGFPSKSNVDILIGGVKVVTLKTDVAGDATKTAKIPNMAGGTYTVLASSGGLMATAEFTIETGLVLKVGKTTLVEDTPVADGSSVNVVGSGFRPLEEVTMEDTGTGVAVNLVTADLITKVSKGTLGDATLAATEIGSFDFTYTIDITVGAGTPITFSADGPDSGTVEATFLAQGTPTMELPVVTAEPQETITLDVGDDFGDLVDGQKYNLMIDGKALSKITVDGVTNAKFFTSDDAEVEIAAPKSEGVHRVALIYYKEKTPLDEDALVVSTAGETAKISLLSIDQTTEEPVGYEITTAVVGQLVGLALFNFDADEAGVTADMVTATDPSFGLGAVDVDGNGADLLLFEVPETIGGTTLIFVTRDDDTTVEKTFTLAPSITLSDDEGPSGTALVLAATGLGPTVDYTTKWDVGSGASSAGTAVGDPFRTDEVGSGGVAFDVPRVIDGTYYVSLAPNSKLSSPVKPYDDEGNLDPPSFEVVSGVTWEPDANYVALEVASFSWESGEAAGGDPVPVKVELDGVPIVSGVINEDGFSGSSTAATVEWSETTLTGSFLMPNGESGQSIEVTVSLDDSETFSLIQRIAATNTTSVGGGAAIAALSQPPALVTITSIAGAAAGAIIIRRRHARKEEALGGEGEEEDQG